MIADPRTGRQHVMAVLQAELAWFAGDGQRTSEHLARAAELVEDTPASASKYLAS